MTSKDHRQLSFLDDMPPMLQVREIASHCNVHPRTVTNWIKHGKLDAVRFGRSYRISKDEYLRFLRNHALS